MHRGCRFHLTMTQTNVDASAVCRNVDFQHFNLATGPRSHASFICNSTSKKKGIQSLFVLWQQLQLLISLYFYFLVICNDLNPDEPQVLWQTRLISRDVVPSHWLMRRLCLETLSRSPKSWDTVSEMNHFVILSNKHVCEFVTSACTVHLSVCVCLINL